MSDQDKARISELEEEIQYLLEKMEQQKVFLRSIMGSYLTDEVLDEILRSNQKVTIGGERRVVTMLFSDIRGSTDLSEQLSSVDFIRMLNHYLAEMIELINAWQGNILEFVGDAIVVVFGAPRENSTAAMNAVACAVAMQRRMDAVNEWNVSQGFPPISHGIGIHTGEAILGTIGSATRAKYDMIGRNVNLASRIQGYTQGGQILISTDTLRSAGDSVVVDPAGEMIVKPKGIRDEVLLHDVIGFGKQMLKNRSVPLPAAADQK